MRTTAIILNILLPGVGSLMYGCYLEAAIQAALVIFALLYTIAMLGYGIILGLPLLLLAWF
jgi:hypothetical protein